ncbi:MAG: M91 family zinc metallopeptidase [Angustibacter sp.]
MMLVPREFTVPNLWRPPLYSADFSAASTAWQGIEGSAKSSISSLTDARRSFAGSWSSSAGENFLTDYAVRISDLEGIARIAGAMSRKLDRFAADVGQAKETLADRWHEMTRRIQAVDLGAVVRVRIIRPVDTVYLNNEMNFAEGIRRSLSHHLPGLPTPASVARDSAPSVTVDEHGGVTFDTSDKRNLVEIKIHNGMYWVTVDGMAQDPISIDLSLTINTHGGDDKVRVIGDTVVERNGYPKKLKLRVGSGVDIVDASRSGGGGLYVDGGDGHDRLLGGRGADILVGRGEDDYIDGGSGFNQISGGLGDDTILGGVHQDIIYGGSGNDLIRDHGGRNYLNAGQGDDVVVGGPDRDTIVGGRGVDRLSGGAGDDILYSVAVAGSPEVDFVDGGAGNDLAYVQEDELVRAIENRKDVEPVPYQIHLKGLDPEWRDSVVNSFDFLASSPQGSLTLTQTFDKIDNSTYFRGSVIHVGDVREASVDVFDPPGPDPWYGQVNTLRDDPVTLSQPFELVMNHEVRHVRDMVSGDMYWEKYIGTTNGEANWERITTGLPIDHDKDLKTPRIVVDYPGSENALAEEMGFTPRSEYGRLWGEALGVPAPPAVPVRVEPAGTTEFKLQKIE